MLKTSITIQKTSSLPKGSCARRSTTSPLFSYLCVVAVSISPEHRLDDRLELEPHPLAQLPGRHADQHRHARNEVRISNNADYHRNLTGRWITPAIRSFSARPSGRCTTRFVPLGD